MIADPFKTLGISENASDAELKKAYRDLSKKYHPDANPQNPQAAEEKFKEVQEAYQQIVQAKAKGTSPYGNRGGYGSGYGTGYGGNGGYGAGYGGNGAYGSSGNGYNGGYQNNYGNGYSNRDYNGQNGDYREYNEQSYSNFNDFFNSFFGGYSQQRQQPVNESNEMKAARNYINSGYYQEALTALSGMAPADRNARWYYYSSMANAGLGSNISAMEHAKRAVDMEPDNAEYYAHLQRLQRGGQSYQQRGAGYGGAGNSGTGLCLGICAANLACTLCGGGGWFCL